MKTICYFGARMGTTRRWAFVVYILLSVALASGTTTTQTPGEPVSPNSPPIDTRCPCLPAGDCPRVYDASSDDDISHFGHLPDCKDALMVRCCGAKVEVRESVSVGFHNGSMDIVNQSLSIVQKETDVLTTGKLEMVNGQSNGTFDKVTFLKPEGRSSSQQEVNSNIEDPVNRVSKNKPETIELRNNDTISIQNGNATADVLKYVNATAEEEREEPEAASSELDTQQITPENISQNANMKSELLPTDASNSSEPVSTDDSISAEPISTDTSISAEPISADTSISAEPISTDTSINTEPISADTSISAEPFSTDTSISAEPISTDTSISAGPISSDTSISAGPISTDTLISPIPNATAEIVGGFYPPALYSAASKTANVTANTKTENATRQVSVSDSSETDIAGDNTTSMSSVSPLSESGNNEGMSRSLEADEFDNRSEDASVAESSNGQDVYETGMGLKVNSSQLYPGVGEEDQNNGTMSLDSDKNDTTAIRAAENEATMKRMRQIPGIMYVFPMHNTRKRTEKKAPFLVFPTRNATNNEAVEGPAMANKTAGVFVANSDLDSMASTAEGVSSTVKGKVIIRKFMPKVKAGHGRGNSAALKNRAVTAAPINSKESEKSTVATDNQPQKSTTASPTRTENNTTPSSINSKPNLKYKINTRRLPSKFYIKARANGKIDAASTENNSSLLTQGPVTNRTPSLPDKGIDINAPIRSKSIMIKRIALKSNAEAATSVDDASRLEASGSEHREDVLLPEGGADANRRAIPSRESVAHPSRTTPKAARPNPASRRRQPVALATEDVKEGDSVPVTQTIRPRTSSFRRRPVMVEEKVSTTTAEPKKLGSYLVNIRIKPIFGETDSNETTVAPVESYEGVEGVTGATGAPLESLKLNESISIVVSSTESDVMVSNTTALPDITATTSLPEVQDQIENVTISEIVQSPKVDAFPTVYVSTSENPEVILVEKPHETLAEHLPPTKARVSYTRTTPRNPTSKSEIKISSRQKENGKVVENKGDVTPKASFPRRGSVRFNRPSLKFDREGGREVAQESQIVGVLETSNAVKKTVTETVENTRKESALEVVSMKIVLPGNHDSVIPVKIMLSNTEEDGVIEVMLPKMITTQVASQVRPTRSSNNGLNPPKRVEQGIDPYVGHPGFFSIVGPIPKGFSDPSVQSPVLDLPNQNNFKKFRDPPVKRFLKPVIDVEEMKRQHHLFLLKRFNEQKTHDVKKTLF